MKLFLKMVQISILRMSSAIHFQITDKCKISCRAPYYTQLWLHEKVKSMDTAKYSELGDLNRILKGCNKVL